MPDRTRQEIEKCLARRDFVRMAVAAAVMPDGRTRRYEGQSAPRYPVWAVIVSYAGGAAVCHEIEWLSTGGNWHEKEGGRVFDPAYEVNDYFESFDWDEFTGPVGKAIQIFPVHVPPAEDPEWWYHFGPVAPPPNVKIEGSDYIDVDGGVGPSYVWMIYGPEIICTDGRIAVSWNDAQFKWELALGAAFKGLAYWEDSFDFIEVWPALVITAADPIAARIWIPGSDFPPAVDDDYHLTADQATVNITFDQAGPGSFAAKTLEPALEDYDGEAEPPVEDWIQVRCRPGAFQTEDGARPIPPNGQINTFSATLAALPLPYSVTFEWENPIDTWHRLYSARAAVAGDDFHVDLAGEGGAGMMHYRTGVGAVVLSDNPPVDAAMRWRYIAVVDCDWSWLVTPHTRGTFPVKVSDASGSSPDFSYTVEDLEGNELGTGVPVEQEKHLAVWFQAADDTYGLACYDGGSLKLLIAFGEFFEYN